MAYLGFYTFVAGFASACLLFAYAPLGVCVAVLLGAVVFILKSRAEPARFALVLTFCASVGLGILWASFYTQFVFSPAQRLEGSVSGLPVQVIEEPVVYSRYANVTVKADSGDFFTPDVKISLYYDSSTVTLKTGDRFSLSGTISDSREKGFYYFSRGITLLCENAGLSDIESPASLPFWLIPASTARIVSERADLLFSGETSEFAKALISGERSSIEPALRFDLANSGLSHIIALSGMNLAFLAGILLLILPKRAAPFVVLPVVLFFMAMTGFSPSLLRAGIMLFLSLLGPLLHRDATPVNSLVFALFLIVLFNPYTITQASLVLSFLATLGILLFGGSIRKAITFKTPFKGLNRCISGFAGILATTLAATFLSIPALVLFFGRIPLISPLSNLACLWAVGLCFVLSLLAVGISFVFPPLASLLAAVVEVLYRYIAECAGYFANIPFASLGTSSVYAKLFILFAYAVVLALYLFRPKKHVTASAVFALACLFCFAAFLTNFEAELFRVRFFNVGQGQSILVSYAGETILFDCGGNRSDGAGDIVAEYLYSENITEIDRLVLSHFDGDHVSGLERLLIRTDITEAYVPPEDGSENIIRLLENDGTAVHIIPEHIGITGDIPLDIYHVNDIMDENPMLMTLVRYGDFEMLVTGDADVTSELYLLFTEHLPDLDLLVAAHHGSNNSTSERLLRDIRPEYAVISVGSNNYGHPSAAVLNRLSDTGAAIYRTDEDGEIVLTIKNGESKITTEK